MWNIPLPFQKYFPLLFGVYCWENGNILDSRVSYVLLGNWESNHENVSQWNAAVKSRITLIFPVVSVLPFSYSNYLYFQNCYQLWYFIDRNQSVSYNESHWEWAKNEYFYILVADNGNIIVISIK